MSEFPRPAVHETSHDNELEARLAELKGQMVQFVDAIIDNPELFELQPEGGEEPQYMGGGAHDRKRVYTRDGVFIEAQRTVEPDEEAFRPGATVTGHTLLVDFPGSRVYVSNNSRFKQLAKAELKTSDVSGSIVDKLGDVRGLEEIIATIDLARESALKTN